MAQVSNSNDPRDCDRSDTDSGIARLLRQRFGDGLVYFRDEYDRKLFSLAVERGLLCREGYMTSDGHSFLATHGNH